MTVTRLAVLEETQRVILACRACPAMHPPPVVGRAVLSRVMIVGQAPGPREASFAKPFAYTAGKTLFGWFDDALGVDEETLRERVYISAVARCFPGKAKGGGDRKPDRDEIARCSVHLERETKLLQPGLVIPIGALAIEVVTGHRGKLVEVIGTSSRVCFHGVDTEAIALPHPSGVSRWHRTEPGRTLLAQALGAIGAHPLWREAVELHKAQR